MQKKGEKWKKAKGGQNAMEIPGFTVTTKTQIRPPLSRVSNRLVELGRRSRDQGIFKVMDEYPTPGAKVHYFLAYDIGSHGMPEAHVAQPTKKISDAKTCKLIMIQPSA